MAGHCRQPYLEVLRELLHLMGDVVVVEAVVDRLHDHRPDHVNLFLRRQQLLGAAGRRAGGVGLRRDVEAGRTAALSVVRVLPFAIAPDVKVAVDSSRHGDCRPVTPKALMTLDRCESTLSNLISKFDLEFDRRYRPVRWGPVFIF